MTAGGTDDPRPVLCDTDVFSKLLVRRSHPVETEQWRALLAGRTIAIATQTKVELQMWPFLRGWGQTRTDELATLLAGTPTVPVDEAVQQSYVRLGVWAKEHGHPLWAASQCGDRWIAATALAHDLEFLTGNRRHYEGAEAAGLRLL